MLLFHFTIFVKNLQFVDMWIDIQGGLISVPLVLISVFMPISSCSQYCGSVMKFKVRDCDAFSSSLIVQDYLGYPEFCFPYEVEDCSFEVCEEFCCDFNGHLH